MNKLVVNPGTPQAWEIQLKPGTNTIGRGTSTDFQIAHPEVSGTHCEITVTDGGVLLKDLGSTNGTFVNNAAVQEARLEPGQSFRLGSVQMVLQADTPAPAPISAPPPPPAPAGGIRLRREAAVAEADAPPPMALPTMSPPPPPVSAGPAACKFHPKSPARYRCNKCNRSFCDLCVTTLTIHGEAKKRCRTCGVDCVPLQVKFEAAKESGFFGSLPGALIYPFKGTGLLILIAGTLLFAALAIMSAGWMSILMKIVALGYMFSYMQNIIHATAAEEVQMPELPAMDGLFGAFFSLAGTVMVSFGLAIGLAVARFMFDVEAIPTEAIIAAVILGCLYFPMAFLAVAMKDTVMAANPLIVIPGILKVPLEYIVTVILLTSVFGVQRLGDILNSGAASVSLTTRSMSVLFMSFGFRACWSFISVYLLTVNMRILGLLYLTKKEKLQWF